MVKVDLTMNELRIIQDCLGEGNSLIIRKIQGAIIKTKRW